MNYNYNRNDVGNYFITSTLDIIPDFIRYPPTSKLPQNFNSVHRMRTKFVDNTANMLPKLQNFNRMYQSYADGLTEKTTKLLPPGHPLYAEQNSLVTLKEENEKLKKEIFELRNQLKNNKERTEEL
tara:strand:+ start:57 stop:434 length:378 start_codon:yes stop_codon:yes gene_type:complete